MDTKHPKNKQHKGKLEATASEKQLGQHGNKYLVIQHKWKDLVIVPDDNRGAKVVTNRFNICIFLKVRKYIFLCEMYLKYSV